VRVDTAILDFLTRRLLDLPMSYFHSRRTGDIQRRLEGAREICRFVVQHGIGSLLAMLPFTGCVALMTLYSFWMSLVFAAILSRLTNSARGLNRRRAQMNAVGEASIPFTCFLRSDRSR